MSFFRTLLDFFADSKWFDHPGLPFNKFGNVSIYHIRNIQFFLSALFEMFWNLIRI